MIYFIYEYRSVDDQVFGSWTPEHILWPMTTIWPVGIDLMIGHQNRLYCQTNCKISILTFHFWIRLLFSILAKQPGEKRPWPSLTKAHTYFQSTRMFCWLNYFQSNYIKIIYHLFDKLAVFAYEVLRIVNLKLIFKKYISLCIPAIILE